MGTLTAVLLVLAAVVGSLAIDGTPAAASCVGPTVEVEPREVPPGGTITVRGEYFGDNCFDTGEPPDGQGALGRPLAGIELEVIQGGDETVLARGAADDGYEFTVDVVVPASLAPGPATVRVYGPGLLGGAPTENEVMITSAPADVSSGGAVATCGPEAAPRDPSALNDPAATDRSSSSSNTAVWLFAGGLLVVFAAAIAVAFAAGRRRSRGA